MDPEGEFKLEPQSILQKNMLMLQNQAIKKIKVQWKHFRLDEATWEMVDDIRAMYPSLFAGLENVFWYMFWCGVLVLSIYAHVCKYHIELCYKAPISGMVVML